MSEWQPIETAPSGEVMVCSGSWVFTAIRDRGGAWVASCGGDVAYTGASYECLAREYLAPTHWMPKPACPEHGETT